MSDNAPGWQPDPTGKHDHRYWDGNEWTENVADAGVAGIDPYEASAPGEVPAEAPLAEEPVAEQPVAGEPVHGDEPTVVDQEPVAPDATEAYPATVEQPAAWAAAAGAADAPAPPPPYVADESSGDGGSKKGLLIGGGILAAVILAVIAFFALGGDDDGNDGQQNTSNTSDTTDEDGGTTTDTTGPPSEGSYGSDPDLDELYDSCEDGDFAACDQLYLDSPSGSEYEAFGDSCGDRNEPAGFCVDIYETGDEGSDGSDGTDGTDISGDLEESISEQYQSMLGLNEEQADCLAGKMSAVIEEGTIDESQAMTEIMDYLSDCDISPTDLSSN